MVTYLVLASWTEQGILGVKHSPARLDAARALAKTMGITLREFHLTTGASDMVMFADAPDDESMAKFALTMGMGGNIRTTTSKVFSEDAYRKMVAGL